jgi:hypothetical protein
MLQKVPLHIASTEASLKEAIWKSGAVSAIASAQPISTGSTSGSRKRKLSKNVEQHSPSPSVTKRRRIQIDSGCTSKQQPSPKYPRDSLLAQGGLPTANQHRPIGGTLRSVSRSASCSNSTAQTPNPGQRSSMHPTTPRTVPTTPSRTHSVTLPDRHAQPSSLSHKNQRASDASVSPHFARRIPNAQPVPPVPLNHLIHPNDVFKAPNPFYIHTPHRAGSKRLNDGLTRPSAPVPSSVGFSAVRDLLICTVIFSPRSPYPPFSHRDEGNDSFKSRTMTTMKFSTIDARQITECI